MNASPDAAEKVRARLARRQVHVTGRWHLWIYCCHWSILIDGREAAHDESPDDSIRTAVERLDGQRITSVSEGPTPGSWSFTFDLGGELRTSPYGEDPTYEQWMLFERESGWVLTVRADNQYFYGPGNQHPEDISWKPI
jgi:hypothetical protein